MNGLYGLEEKGAFKRGGSFTIWGVGEKRTDPNCFPSRRPRLNSTGAHEKTPSGETPMTGGMRSLFGKSSEAWNENRPWGQGKAFEPYDA